MTTKAEALAEAALGKGCLGKAADDEPLFILRAQDMTASTLVDLWADINHANASPEKIIDARKLADAMRRWPTRKAAT